MEDMKLFTPHNTFRVKQPSKQELKEGRTLFRSEREDYMLKKLLDVKILKWTYAGIRDIDGKKMGLWLMAIEIPGSSYNMISVTDLNLSGNSFILFLGDSNDVGGRIGAINVITLRDASRKRLMSRCNGSAIYTFFYTEDINADPNITPPFAIKEILFPWELRSDNLNAIVTNCVYNRPPGWSGYAASILPPSSFSLTYFS